MIENRSRYLWIELAIIIMLWLLLLGLTPLGWGIDWPIQFWVRQVLFAGILTATYFTNTLILVPKLLLTNRYKQYGLAVMIIVISIIAGIRAIEHGLDLPRLMHAVFQPDKPYKPGNWFRLDVPGLLMILMALGVSTSIVLIRKDHKDTLVRQELEKEKVSAELSFLKAQINPHFFFNTLNNIYALTSIDVSMASEAIHKLSAMMRYVLYDARKEFTLISQEIKFIENYIELMKLRLPEKVSVVFEKPTDVADELVAPMLLLPYIENAFKHGVSSQAQSSIAIKLRMKKRMLFMEVENTIFENNSVKLEGSGIGLTNTRRRLELLYPNRHAVQIKKEDNRYIVNFQVDLSS